MEQFQGSLCSILQRDPKITKDLEYRRLCSKLTRCTSQCFTFHQDAAVPHPGTGKSLNGYTSRQNIVCADHEYDIGAIEPSHYPRRKTRDSTIRERPAEKSGHCSNPAEHGHRVSSNLTRRIQTQTKTKTCTPRAGKTSTLTGTAPLTSTR